jgi:hypothetical protein
LTIYTLARRIQGMATATDPKETTMTCHRCRTAETEGRRAYCDPCAAAIDAEERRRAAIETQRFEDTLAATFGRRQARSATRALGMRR